MERRTPNERNRRPGPTLSPSLLVCPVALVLLGMTAMAEEELPQRASARKAPFNPPILQRNDEQSAETKNQAPRPGSTARVIVLTSGRVIQGHAVADERGYLISTATGRLYFTFEHVKLTAMDLEEAHERMVAQMAGHSAGHEIAMARWCMENSLPAQAAEHLRAALRKDPANAAAKDLMARLEGAREAAGGHSSDAPDQPANRASNPSAARAGGEPLSFARVSGASVSEFVTSIQPLLLARCGSVRCHGSEASTKFRLQHVRMGWGNNRSATVRNLDAVLTQLASSSGSRNGFLAAALQTHGGLSRPPLQGPGGFQQQAILRRWVRSVSAQVAGAGSETAQRASETMLPSGDRRTPIRDPHLLPVSAMQSSDTGSAEPGLPRLQSGPAGARCSDSAKQKRPVLSGEALGPLTDPYDPAEFNSGHPHQR